MPELPQITLPEAVVIPPRERQSLPSGFLESLNITASLDPGKPWTLQGSLRAYDPQSGAKADGTNQIQLDNLQLAMMTYPAVAQVGGAILQTVSSLLAPLAIEEQIKAALHDIDAKGRSIDKASADGDTAIMLATANKATADLQFADWQAGLTQAQAGDAPTKEQDIVYLQGKITEATQAATDAATAIQQAIDAKATAVATATQALADAQTLVWVTLADQWRQAAAPLGVSAEAVPMALYGLTRPDGI